MIGSAKKPSMFACKFGNLKSHNSLTIPYNVKLICDKRIGYIFNVKQDFTAVCVKIRIIKNVTNLSYATL